VTIGRVAALAAFAAFSAVAATTISTGVPPSGTVLPSEGSCTQPSSTVACSVVGQFYTAELALNQVPPNSGTPTWSFVNGATPAPPNLAIDSATGFISVNTPSGKLPVAGLYTFIVKVTFSASTLVVTQQYSIAISAAQLTIISPQSLSLGGALGSSTLIPFTASGGVPFIDNVGNSSYQWSIVSCSQPDGLVMDQNSGTLSGTPVNAGNFPVTIGVIDAVGTPAIHVYSLTVSGTNTLTITPTSPPGGIVGQPYSQNLQQTGGPGSTGGACPSSNPTGTFWTIASGSLPLPPGLGISTNTDGSGTISGTPTAAGTYAFTVQASYQVPILGSVQTVTQTARLSITIAAPLSMANPPAVNGFVSQQVSMQFSAVNGTPPYTYALVGGTLPPGTSLNTQTGAITGPATTAQGSPFTFTIQVTDAAKHTATAQGTITITALNISATITPTGTVTSATQPGVTLTLGAAPGVAISGTLALMPFASANTNADNPEVRFTVTNIGTNLRKVSFTVAADGTVTLPTGIAVITGTVAGTGTLVATFTDSLSNVLLTNSTTFTVPATVPVIQSFTIACSGTTYTATLVGFSSTLDMTGLTLNFTPTSGTNLATPSVTIPQTTVQPAFAAWYANSASAATGSQFKLTVQLTFTVSGGASTNPIVSATAAATNSKGISTVSSPAVPTPACS